MKKGKKRKRPWGTCRQYNQMVDPPMKFFYVHLQKKVYNIEIDVTKLYTYMYIYIYLFDKFSRLSKQNCPGAFFIFFSPLSPSFYSRDKYPEVSW